MNRLLLTLIMGILSIVSNYSQTLDDYRSANTGNWNAIATWQRYNGTAWVAATAAPTSANGLITVQSPHTVTFATGTTTSIDQVTVNTGATLQTTGTANLTMANSAVVGPDLIINGTFNENGTNSVTFAGGATWLMGPNATYIKTRGTSSNVWQNAYDGGNANIPATSNWILRKVAAANPTITTIGAVYGNLTIENNNTTTWNTAAGATFNGATSPAPIIKGNLDIGGAGTNTLNFLNQHTIANPTQVQGNLIIRACNTLSYVGTGIEVRGNVTINGVLRYGTTGARAFNFTGGNNQTVSGTGSMGIYNTTINKSANTVTLSVPVTIDNQATFTSGIINSSNPNYLILGQNAVTTGANNTSFVNGPVRYTGFGAMIFPVGKVTSYRPVSISASAGNVIYTENFNTGGAGWVLNVSMGAEGADPNYWDMDDDEGGMPAGGCGAANNGNPTLHITSEFSPGGGAAYDAGGLCGVLYCPQANRRAESPTINCTGYNGVAVSFTYIENGDCSNDNATLMYFDGVSWSQIDDMPKTMLCGAQGTWTARTVVLPSSANNNPNVKIAFRWINNDDGIGSDPSFAVDDVSISTASVFTAEYFPANPQIPYGNLLVPTLTNLSNCEYWILNRDAGITPRSVTLSWNAASCNITSLSDLRVARYDGISTWQDEGNGGYTGSVVTGTVVSGAPVINFSPFTIANTLSPLPVELGRFDGNCEHGLINLVWNTYSEINNDYFMVQSSSDAIDWKEVRRVKGAGNSNTLQNYGIQYIPGADENYYRLIQVDFDGKTETYTPLNLLCKPGVHLQLYPNPTQGIVTLDADNNEILWPEVYNVQGQKMMQVSCIKETGSSLYRIDLSSLPAGIYYIRCMVNGEWITKSVVVSR